MFRTVKFAASAMFALLICAPNAAQAFTIYTNPTDWQNDVEAIGGSAAIYTETFDPGDPLDPPIDSLTPGFSFVGGNYPFEFPTSSGDYWFRDEAANTTTQNYSTVFDFGVELFAFGADWDLSWLDPNGGGPGLEIFVDSDASAVTTLASGYTGFLGFIVDDPSELFIQLVVSAQSNPQNAELYLMDNVRMAPIPLPAAAWLLLAGFAGFVTLGRRRASEDATAAAA